MGFRDYPPRLDTANPPHILVCGWRMLMEAGKAEEVCCGSKIKHPAGGSEFEQGIKIKKGIQLWMTTEGGDGLLVFPHSWNYIVVVVCRLLCSGFF